MSFLLVTIILAIYIVLMLAAASRLWIRDDATPAQRRTWWVQVAVDTLAVAYPLITYGLRLPVEVGVSIIGLLVSLFLWDRYETRKAHSVFMQGLTALVTTPRPSRSDNDAGAIIVAKVLYPDDNALRQSKEE